MDFVEWCDIVLNTLIEVRRSVPTLRTIGVEDRYIAAALFGQEIAGQENFRASTSCRGMLDALNELQKLGAVELKPHWKITQLGLEVAKDPMSLWQIICQLQVEPEHAQLLHLVNRLSPQTAPNYVWREEVGHETLLKELRWKEGLDLLWPVAEDLEELDFIYCRKYFGPTLQCWATYRGQVWETRRGLTLESKFIDDLVTEWETTSVEFKQYLYVGTVEQKAEFVRDVLSLANTQASGRRWIIIGFSDKTHGYANPPNPLHQDDLERLLAGYTDPPVEVRYQVVAYRKGPVGKLEVLRDPKKVPHRVAKPLGDKLKGDKKQIIRGQIFVRHGSQVEEPTQAELQALQEEGDRARSTFT